MRQVLLVWVKALLVWGIFISAGAKNGMKKSLKGQKKRKKKRKEEEKTTSHSFKLIFQQGQG